MSSEAPQSVSAADAIGGVSETSPTATPAKAAAVSMLVPSTDDSTAPSALEVPGRVSLEASPLTEGVNGLHEKSDTPGRRSGESAERATPSMSPSKQNLNANAESFTPNSTGTQGPSPSGVAACNRRKPANTRTELRGNASRGQPLPPPPPPPPPMYQPPLMMSALIQNMAPPPPPPPPPPMSSSTTPFYVPQHSLPAPSPMMQHFVAGIGAVQPPPPPPPPPFMPPPPPPCGPMPYASAMGVPMSSMMMAKAPELTMLSAVFSDGTMAPPPPPPPPPPSSAPSAQLLPPSLAASLTSPPQSHHHALAVPKPRNARVSVGNATLAALVSKEPPKFSCVLLSGIPAVGKTTMGRELVNELKKDGLGWVFFSGADFLAGSTTKRPVWDTTREVFDALQKRLDELLEQQKQDRNVKGLVIDKNVKGAEDIYYLAALLRARQIPFVGIVGMEAENDEVLLDRMGGDEELREKLKYHRVIHARIRALAKITGMYREIDATKSKEEVLNSLRTMVLGCCAQPPQRGIRTELYMESSVTTMVDNHSEYCAVMTRLFELVKSTKTPMFQYPGTTEYTPLSTREMSDKNRVTAIKAHYGVRCLNDGARHLLLYHDEKLYLVPTHLKAVLRLPEKAWLGSRLNTIGSFVLEGDLVRLHQERNCERFLVFDVLCWCDIGEQGKNKVAWMSWMERQSLLAAHLCAEGKVSTPVVTDCIVVHQKTVGLEDIFSVLEPAECPSYGLVFQPISSLHSYGKVYVWRPPSSITVEFRIGRLIRTSAEPITTESGAKEDAILASSVNTPSAISSVQQQLMMSSTYSLGQSMSSQGGFSRSVLNEAIPTRTFELEVYDKHEKEYTQFEDCTVDVKHPDVVEGCICTCVLADENSRTWTFQRIRYDMLRPAYKRDVAALLEHCVIPKPKLVQWITHHKVAAPPVSGTSPLPPPPPTTTTTTPLPPPPLPMATTTTTRTSSSSSATATAAAAAGLARSTKSHHGSSLPTYATAVMMQQCNVQPHAATPIAETHMAESTGCRTMRLPASSAQGLESRGALPTSHRAPARKSNSLMHPVSEARADALNDKSASTDAQRLTPLQLLSTMVSSVHVVRTDDAEEKHRGGATQTNQRQQHQQSEQFQRNRKGGATQPTSEKGGCDKGLSKRGQRQGKASEGEKGAASITPEQCSQCFKKKQVEDLRLDKRDHKYYCYSCWAKLGWEFCRECGEFKEGYRERTRRRVGEFYCNKCWASFNKEYDDAKQKRGGHATKGQNGQQQQQQEEDGGVDVAAKEAGGRRGAAERRASRKTSKEKGDSNVDSSDKVHKVVGKVDTNTKQREKTEESAVSGEREEEATHTVDVQEVQAARSETPEAAADASELRAVWLS